MVPTACSFQVMLVVNRCLTGELITQLCQAMAEGRRLIGSTQLSFSMATSPSLIVEGSFQSTQNEWDMYVTGHAIPFHSRRGVFLLSKRHGEKGKSSPAWRRFLLLFLLSLVSG